MLVLGFWLSIIISCNNSGSEWESNACSGGMNSIRKEIPIESDGDTALGHFFAREISADLGLNDMERGFDSLQIRIWLPIYNYKEYVLEIKGKARIWRCALYEYEADYGKRFAKVENWNKRVLHPKSDWNHLMRKLEHVGLLRLPDCRTIKGYDLNFVHGPIYQVEVATCKSYRMYEYWTPSKNKINFKEAMIFEKILSIIRDEFSLEGILHEVSS